MGRKLMVALWCISVLLCACSGDEGDQKDLLDGAWDLIHISGGFAGINDDYQKGDIVWNFNSNASKILVTNNNSANTLYYGLDSGEYPYAVITAEKDRFLEINGQEFGKIDRVQNTLNLNQNQLSTGNGADGFMLILTQH